MRRQQPNLESTGLRKKLWHNQLKRVNAPGCLKQRAINRCSELSGQPPGSPHKDGSDVRPTRLRCLDVLYVAASTAFLFTTFDLSPPELMLCHASETSTASSARASVHSKYVLLERDRVEAFVTREFAAGLTELSDQELTALLEDALLSRGAADTQDLWTRARRQQQQQQQPPEEPANPGRSAITAQKEEPSGPPLMDGGDATAADGSSGRERPMPPWKRDLWRSKAPTSAVEKLQRGIAPDGLPDAPAMTDAPDPSLRPGLPVSRPPSLPSMTTSSPDGDALAQSNAWTMAQSVESTGDLGLGESSLGSLGGTAPLRPADPSVASRPSPPPPSPPPSAHGEQQQDEEPDYTRQLLEQILAPELDSPPPGRSGTSPAGSPSGTGLLFRTQQGDIGTAMAEGAAAETSAGRLPWPLQQMLQLPDPSALSALSQRLADTLMSPLPSLPAMLDLEGLQGLSFVLPVPDLPQSLNLPRLDQMAERLTSVMDEYGDALLPVGLVLAVFTATGVVIRVLDEPEARESSLSLPSKSQAEEQPKQTQEQEKHVGLQVPSDSPTTHSSGTPDEGRSSAERLSSGPTEQATEVTLPAALRFRDWALGHMRAVWSERVLTRGTGEPGPSFQTGRRDGSSKQALRPAASASAPDAPSSSPSGSSAASGMATQTQAMRGATLPPPAPKGVNAAAGSRLMRLMDNGPEWGLEAGAAARVQAPPADGFRSVSATRSFATDEDGVASQGASSDVLWRRQEPDEGAPSAGRGQVKWRRGDDGLKSAAARSAGTNVSDPGAVGEAISGSKPWTEGGTAGSGPGAVVHLSRQDIPPDPWVEPAGQAARTGASLTTDAASAVFPIRVLRSGSDPAADASRSVSPWDLTG